MDQQGLPSRSNWARRMSLSLRKRSAGRRVWDSHLTMLKEVTKTKTKKTLNFNQRRARCSKVIKSSQATPPAWIAQTQTQPNLDHYPTNCRKKWVASTKSTGDSCDWKPGGCQIPKTILSSWSGTSKKPNWYNVFLHAQAVDDPPKDNGKFLF